ncbi:MULTISPECIES: PLP-dependent aminotransferase family protein [unclassified Dyella]|uniref:MocR-like pyridoxine biosynthesis transcription factor PdxR n=1 Tax=unclassified Dyella TaxID=2634549 RepID=UPI000C85B4F5|nr:MULTISPECIES: PLP-dependent aminotransferase family protein [unclassified Dyella]MDR3446561.1 PLP-dependent aminotransferase family protein [Dyella sp.]PMQ03884.1 HTH-type transcriptional regulatory protein GabR [Dyella sp. AD56]
MQRIPAGFLPPVAMDVGSDMPMYQQLSEWFRRSISSGQLRPGQRVPSTRSLAHELGISRIPVLGAYEQLQSEGFLETFTGAGTCVARAIPADMTMERAKRASFLSASPPGGSRRTSRRAVLMRSPEATWLANMGAFRVGLPALDAFPFALWSKLVSRHARHLSMEAMGYGDPMGHLPLREAIAEYLGAARAVRCDASQVLITTGAQQALQICAHVLLDPGERVWMEDPGYPGAHQALRTAGAELVPVPVDAEGIDVAHGARVGADARAVYISPSHQFPLGMAMSASRRMQLLRWAASNDAWIIEDDYDSEYRFGSRPLSSLQGTDTHARVIYIGTFSKVMFPALRLGYIVVPPDLVPDFHAGRDAIDTFSSMLYQSAMTEFIREGHFARHIRSMRTLYMERRVAVHEAIRRYLGDRLEVIGTEAGMQLAGLLPPGVDDVAVSRRAASMGVSVRPLTPCYIVPPERGGLILGYGGASLADIDDGVRKLSLCL